MAVGKSIARYRVRHALELTITEPRFCTDEEVAKTCGSCAICPLARRDTRLFVWTAAEALQQVLPDVRKRLVPAA